MKKVAAFLCVFFSFAVAGYSQVARRTVTNLDLEKYSRQRIEADREYRQTYAEKGLPSPEEIRAQSDARVKETIELADKIRQANLERERLAVEAMQAQAASQPIVVNQGSSPYYYPDYGYWGYGYGGGLIDGFGNRRIGRGRLINNRGYYAAGGVVWPAPLSSNTGFARPGFQRPVVRPRR
jgi:hypothetical protein